MKLRILSWEYQNIRKIDYLRVSLDENKDINFFMMSNGTGKTTTITLLRAIFDGSAKDWSEATVKGFAPKQKADVGFFAVEFVLEDKKYIIKILLDYKSGQASYQTSKVSIQGGLEDGWKLSTKFQQIFTPKFVSRFIFDGEQAKKTLSNESNEAEEAIYYLYQLDEFDRINAKVDFYLSRVRDANAKGETSQGFKSIRTRFENRDAQLQKLENDEKNLSAEIKQVERRIENNRKKIERKVESDVGLREKQAQLKSRESTVNQNIQTAMIAIRAAMREPQAMTIKFAEAMSALASNMQKLKLPRSMSKEFFRELANAPTCICGHEIGEQEKQSILSTADIYLGEDELVALNAIKDKLKSYNKESTLAADIETLRNLIDERDVVVGALAHITDELAAHGDAEAQEIKEAIENDLKALGELSERYEVLTCKNTTGKPKCNDKTNIKLATEAKDEALDSYEKATRSRSARIKTEKLKDYCKRVKQSTLDKLKASIIEDTNSEIAKIIKTDTIHIKSIANNLVLDRAAGSEGQSLDIAYAFIGTLFAKSSFDFPFIIDSPAGKIDLGVRKEIAGALPIFFNQLIVFVISSEVENFANLFYSNNKAGFFTILSKEELALLKRDDSKTACIQGTGFFDSFQRTHKEAE
jgi:DNA sulfur modification protein DndD